MKQGEEAPKVRKWSAKVAKSDPRDTKSEPKDTKSEPKGGQRYFSNRYLILMLGSIFLDRNVQVYLKKVAYS